MMKIFESNKNAGIALVIFGLLSIFMPLMFSITIILDPDIWHDMKSTLVLSVSSTVTGLIEILDGIQVYMSKQTKKEIIYEYVTVFAIIVVIDSLAEMIAISLDGHDPDGEAFVNILSLIAAVASIFVMRSLNEDSVVRLDVLAWYLIVIFFSVSFLMNIVYIIDEISNMEILEVMNDACMFIVYGFVITGMMLKETRSEIGIKL